MKAGQDLEPASEMQLCARTRGATRAQAPKERNLGMSKKQLVRQSSVKVWVNGGSPMQISNKVFDSSQLMLYSSSPNPYVLCRDDAVAR